MQIMSLNSFDNTHNELIKKSLNLFKPHNIWRDLIDKFRSIQANNVVQLSDKVVKNSRSLYKYLLLLHWEYKRKMVILTHLEMKRNKKTKDFLIAYMYYVMRLCLRINACKVLITVANVFYQWSFTIVTAFICISWSIILKIL